MGQTSIPCDSEVRDRLAEDKPTDQSWSEYLSVLHSDQEIVINSPREQVIDVEDSRLLAQHVERSLEPYFCDIVDVNDASDIRDAGQQQMDKLTTIESAAKEATQAAQSAEQSVEELQP